MLFSNSTASLWQCSRWCRSAIAGRRERCARGEIYLPGGFRHNGSNRSGLASRWNLLAFALPLGLTWSKCKSDCKQLQTVCGDNGSSVFWRNTVRRERQRGDPDVDLIVCATNALLPVIEPGWLVPGVHLSCGKRPELAQNRTSGAMCSCSIMPGRWSGYVVGAREDTFPEIAARRERSAKRKSWSGHT